MKVLKARIHVPNKDALARMVHELLDLFDIGALKAGVLEKVDKSQGKRTGGWIELSICYFIKSLFCGLCSLASDVNANGSTVARWGIASL